MLTNSSWGIRNVELLFDVLFLVVLLFLSAGITSFYFSLLALPFFLFTISGILLFILCKKFFGYVYPVGIFSDIFLGFLFMPLAWMNGAFLGLTLVFSVCIFFFLLYRFHVRIPISILELGLQSTVFAIFRGRLSEAILLVPSDEILNAYWIPNFIPVSPFFGEGTESVWILLSWLGFFPYFLGVFRRYSVMFIGFLMFLWVAYSIEEPLWEQRILVSLNYSGFFFAVYLLPARSHYSGIYASLISLGILGILTVFLASFWIGNLIAGFFIYFLVEAIISKVFMVSVVRRGSYESPT